MALRFGVCEEKGAFFRHFSPFLLVFSFFSGHDPSGHLKLCALGVRLVKHRSRLPLLLPLAIILTPLMPVLVSPPMCNRPGRRIETPFRPSKHRTCLCTPRAPLRLACCHQFQWIVLTPGVILLSPVLVWPLLSKGNCSRKQWILPFSLLFLWTRHCTTGRHRSLPCRRWFWRESKGYLDLRDLFLSLAGTLLTPESSENWTKFSRAWSVQSAFVPFYTFNYDGPFVPG